MEISPQSCRTESSVPAWAHFRASSQGLDSMTLVQPGQIRTDKPPDWPPWSMPSSKASLPLPTETTGLHSPVPTPECLPSSQRPHPERGDSQSPLKLAADMLGSSYHPLDIPKSEMITKIVESATADEVQALYIAYCIVDDQRKWRKIY